MGGRFKKGQSGNPGGRPKKNREIEELAQKALQEGTRNLAVEALKDIMANGEENNRIAASKLLMGYAYGNPRQRTEVSAHVEVARSPADMSDEELMALIEQGKPK